MTQIDFAEMVTDKKMKAHRKMLEDSTKNVFFFLGGGASIESPVTNIEDGTK